MRKLILIAAIALASTAAHAGQSRSLSLAATDPGRGLAEQPNGQTAEVPKATQTPAPPTANEHAQAAVTAAPATSTEPAAAAKPPETSRPRHRQPFVEARVIRELHRHGIYW